MHLLTEIDWIYALAPRPGEQLAIARRRAALSKTEMAGLLGVSRYVYATYELGGRPWTCPRVPVGRLSAGERCWILRRRAGLQVRELASMAGFSPSWIIQAEHDRSRMILPLLLWWRKKRELIDGRP